MATGTLNNERDANGGVLNVLRQMGSNSVTALRYYGKTEAQSRFGVDYMQGLIQVITAHGSRDH